GAGGARRPTPWGAPRRRPRRAAGEPARPVPTPVPVPAAVPLAAVAAVPVTAVARAAASVGEARARVLAPPPVRRLARDLGVDLGTVHPTGPGGTIARADVTAAARLAESPGPRTPASGAGAPAAPRGRGGDGLPSAAGIAGGEATGGEATDGAGMPPARPGDRIPVRGVARQMALAMERSAFTVPQATVARSVDVTAMLGLLARWRADAEGSGTRPARLPARITPLAFIARAVVAALAAHPLANSRWLAAPDGSCEIEMYPAVNLGVAVASDRGLVVPVIPGADALALPALAAELAWLVTTARAGRTPPARMRGSTITVSNVGVFGVDSAAGLVREGEAALVVLGAIRETAAVWEGHVQARKVMTISVSFDHRILHGEAASRFLGEIADVLADPARLLLLG
ncbi:2-oxo acid dehydrogenase subunit E2, partial [Frankia nepalensis]|uniref:2-oxo acid dehydrogenase subunit E2 n=1 Tax=Frankia nepalensis TaxID=1836974 RepID=UPI001EE4A982